jgi:hypothetical protein
VRLEPFFRVLFVVYCLEAGLLLAVTPWTSTWERLLLTAGPGLLRALAPSTWLRGLVSGFGLVHLLWAVHDLDLLLRRPRAR